MQVSLSSTLQQPQPAVHYRPFLPLRSSSSSSRLQASTAPSSSSASTSASNSALVNTPEPADQTVTLPKEIKKEVPRLDPRERRQTFSDLTRSDEFIEEHYECIVDTRARHRVLTEQIYTPIHDLTKYAKQTGRVMFLAFSDIDHQDPLSSSSSPDSQSFDIIYTSPLYRSPTDYPELYRLGTELLNLHSEKMNEIRQASDLQIRAELARVREELRRRDEVDEQARKEEEEKEERCRVEIEALTKESEEIRVELARCRALLDGSRGI